MDKKHFCLLPPFIRRFGMIPESYKIAMTYEEQLLWLCKYVEDTGLEIENIKLALQNIEDEFNSQVERIDTLFSNDEILNNLIASLSERVDSIAQETSGNTTAINNLPNTYGIHSLSQDIILSDENIDLEEGYYYTGNCQVLSDDEPAQVYIDRKSYFYFNPTAGVGFTPSFKVLNLNGSPTTFYKLIEWDNLQNVWSVESLDLTQTVNEFSDRLHVPSAYAVYQAIQESGGGDSTFTSFEEDFVLDSASPTLTEGYYFTGNYQVISSATLPNTVYIDNNSLFYYNPTGGSGFTPIFQVLLNVNEPASLKYNVEYISSAWTKTELISTTAVSNTSTDSQIPTAKAVYDFVMNNISSTFTELTEDFVLDSASPSLTEGYYFTGSYQVISSATLPNTVYIGSNSLFYYNPTGGSGFTPIFQVLLDTNEPASLKYNVEYVSSAWTKTELVSTTVVSNASTDSQIPTAKAVYDALQSGGLNIPVISESPFILYGVHSAGIYALEPGVAIKLEPTTTTIYTTTELSIGFLKYAGNTPIFTIYNTTNIIYISGGTAYTKLLIDIEQVTNKASSITGLTTNTKYPTVNAVVNYVQAEVGSITTALQTINTGTGV